MYPDGALYWHGNKLVPISQNVLSKWSSSVTMPFANYGTYTENTNFIQGTLGTVSVTQVIMDIGTVNAVPITGYTKAKIFTEASNFTSAQYHDFYTITQDGYASGGNYTRLINEGQPSSVSGIYERSLSSYSENMRIGVAQTVNNGTSSAYVKVHAIWLE